MNNEVKFVGGVVGSCVSFMGASINSDELSTIISIICAVVGLVWTIVITGVIPFIKWLKKAKQDGKITAEEIKVDKKNFFMLYLIRRDLCSQLLRS